MVVPSAKPIPVALAGKTMASVETQTEVHLEHSIKAVTWIPVVDQLDPVHDFDEELAESILESERMLADSGNVLPDENQAKSDVNDVDSLEVFREVGGEETTKDGLDDIILYYPEESNKVLLLIFTYFIQISIWMHIMYIFYMLNISEGKEEKPIELGIHTLVKDPSFGGGGVNNRASGERACNTTNNTNNVMKSMKLKLKRGITMDSGSHHNVMSKKLVNRKRIRPSAGSKAGLHYVAANKGKIPNEGEIDFNFETEDGSLESWIFQMAEVNKALAAVADRVDHRYRVVFDKDDNTGLDSSYMLNKATNKIIKMTRVGNVWVVNAIVSAEDAGPGGFGRRG